MAMLLLLTREAPSLGAHKERGKEIHKLCVRVCVCVQDYVFSFLWRPNFPPKNGKTQKLVSCVERLADIARKRAIFRVRVRVRL